MTPKTGAKIEELAKGGASILASKPQKSPSLKNYPACDENVTQLANSLWNTGLIKENSILDILKSGELPPDFSIEQGSLKSIDYIHRKTKDTDIYFVVNSQKKSRELACRFRITGKQPELWHAETGEISKAAVWQENADGTTTVFIPFEPEASVFVLFREPVSSDKHIVSTTIELQKPISKPLPNLEIIKAEYGTFLPDGLVDVTDIIAKNVVNHRLQVQATRDLCGSDPAPGYKKELRVRYKSGDLILEKNAMEKEWLEINTADRGNLEILQAVFGKFERGIAGIPPNHPVYDVTEHVKSRLEAGEFEILVNDRFAAGKNIPTKKALRLVYLTNGEEKTVSISNGGTLKLTQATPEPKLAYKDGVVSWLTPFAGEMTYSSSTGKTKTVQVKSVPEPIELTGEWEVTFPANLGAPAKSIFDTLTSWSSSSNEGIRYFSGTATYRKQFVLPEQLVQAGTSLELDLGDVRVIAEVTINGQPVGILWKTPFRLNINDFVKQGENTLEVKITNLWPNRLIGDEQVSMDFERKGKRHKTVA